MIQQLINDEKFTNIQRAQAGITRLFADAQKTLSFYRVMKNDRPLGVLVPQNLWENIVEDIEALSSPTYLRRVQTSRSQKTRISLDRVKKDLGI